MNNPFKGLQRAAPRGRQQFLRSALVAGQIAIAFVLLIGAALLTTSFARLAGRDLHFDPDQLMTFDFRMAPTEFTRPAGMRRGWPHVEIGPQPSATLERVLARLRTLPGVLSAAGISHHPTNTIVLARTRLTVEGRAESSDGEGTPPVYFLVTPDFFSTMRTPMVRGREFGPGDTGSSPWVAVVNETLARTLLAGRRRHRETDPPRRVVRRAGTRSGRGRARHPDQAGTDRRPNPWFTRRRGNRRQRHEPAWPASSGG